MQCISANHIFISDYEIDYLLRSIININYI
jgi:hypothetical protein